VVGVRIGGKGDEARRGTAFYIPGILNERKNFAAILLFLRGRLGLALPWFAFGIPATLQTRETPFIRAPKSKKNRSRN
jgi:hypothetical protein